MCPFIDKADAQCAEHLTFRNLSRAFAHCAGRYATCPIYQRLCAEKHAHDRRESPVRLLAAS